MEEKKHKELNEAKWDKWAESLDEKGWRNEYLRNCQAGVISLSGIKGNMTFLDIGCGTGWAIGQAAKSVNNKGSFYGVDMSAKMIEKAKENFKENSNFHFIVSNAESIPLEDNMFDIIICTNSFHHHLHPDKTMKEIYRLLKTGGKSYILDPPGDNWYGWIINKMSKLTDPAHVKVHSTKEFEKLITDAGLKYVKSQKIKMHQVVHIGEK